ncbi:DNA topoisomerase 2 [Serendipita sp. 397]|nr:DNA topoisomerase 2 [Serendipita sp. 397]
MSDSESENFDVDGISEASDSDGYMVPVKKKIGTVSVAPKPKATKAATGTSAGAAKKTTSTNTTKAAPKPRVVSGTSKKPKVLKSLNGTDVDADEDAGNGYRDDGSDVEDLPKAKAAPKKNKTVTEQYQKLSQIEHILQRPDSYIGSVEPINQTMWVFDSETKRMVNREIRYVPGFFKIVDEILVNAADNKVNDESMDTLKVNIDVEKGEISVYNNGRGIPIAMHETENMYIPQLIFGNLLTSSNYDDDEKKLTGGRNGYGAKLANIYSHEFKVETACADGKGYDAAKYSQTWTNNMGNVTKPKITSNSRGEEYTRITFRPDLARFHMEEIDEDTLALLQRRVYDMAGTMKTTNAEGKKHGKDVKVFLNNERINIKGFKQYVEMYVSSAADAISEQTGAAASKPTVIHERINERWEVAFTLSDTGGFQQVSFANSIATIKGGTHVNVVSDQIAKSLLAGIQKKNKAATVKLPQIKNHMWLFVNALIENPTFDSQTKETLTLPAGKFGSKPTLSEDFIKRVGKTSIVESILNWAKYKADQQIKKTDGTKRTRLSGMTKLCDANNAGTRYGGNCTLILTEGDSAKALAVAGLSVVGRDNFGVFPLRGKLLNVREASHDQIMKNEEIQNIKKIMGLQHNKDYKSTESLRYGRLMIMADQDHDGSHIKGLLINFFDHFYPSLLKLSEFLVEFVTPIVRVRHGKSYTNFFTIPEYQQWAEANARVPGWTAKYYKGLGTSEDKDAMAYFSDMPTHMIPFSKLRDQDRVLIDMAFSKKKVEERKEWLRNFVPGTYLNHNRDEIPYSEFINKELILFSMADNIRSIPSIVDGLKPSQRKVIFACFKRKLKSEIKVSQLYGYIGETTAHHHGEQALTMTIVGLAQHFVGSNNINLLHPSGQFGTRAAGGKDHASARYISTYLAPLARTIFHPADDALLNYLKEDNLSIEPEWYVPVIPLVLVNGADGIGTGWSTSIPNYNPVDIVANLRRLMKGDEQEPMAPWFRGYKGVIEKVDSKGKFMCSGRAEVIDEKTIKVSELPIRKWTDDYKKQLEDWVVGADRDKEKTDKEKTKVAETFIKDYREYHTTTTVNFLITMAEKDVARAQKEGLEKFFKLTTPINTSNMICFDAAGKIKKYESPEEILEDFYHIRLQYYLKRKQHLTNVMETELDRLNNQARFVQMIIDKKLVVANRKKADIVNDLRELQFRPFPKKGKESEDMEAVVENNPDEDEIAALSGAPSNADFDYLLGMAIWSLTREKVEKLLATAKEQEAKLLKYLVLTPQDIWNEDLDAFLEQWERVLEADIADEQHTKPKKKAATLKTRKSLQRKNNGDYGDSDDEDFAAAAKAKKTARSKKRDNDSDDEGPKARSAANKAKIAAAAAVFKASEGEEDEEPVRNRIPLKAQLSDPSDSEMFPVPKLNGGASKAVSTKTVPTKAALKRKSDQMSLDGSDLEKYVKPAPKKKQKTLEDFMGSSKPKQTKAPAVKKPAAAKKKAFISDEDEAEDSDRVSSRPRTPPPKRTITARTGATKKAAYVDLTSEDEEDVGPKKRVADESQDAFELSD